jgi:hypothetical protein
MAHKMDWAIRVSLRPTLLQVGSLLHGELSRHVWKPNSMSWAALSLALPRLRDETMSLNCGHQRACYSSLRLYINMYRALTKWCWQGKTEELGERPVPTSPCLPQTTHGLTSARTQTSELGNRQLTAGAMARPSFSSGHASTLPPSAMFHGRLLLEWFLGSHLSQCDPEAL